MRNRPLLALLRGEDGRSLARALVVLVLLSLFGGGLATGAAAAGGGTVICAADGGLDVPGDGRGHDGIDCCVAGVAPLGMGLAPAPWHAGVPSGIVGEDRVRPVAEVAASGLLFHRARARAPPEL